MDPRQLYRLQEEQRKAVYETDARIQQIEQFKTDYKVLQDKLKTLPDKMTHDVMVPFGKLAFMPGHLVHTNEILVLLGDNWFVERSAKQAGEIAGRRIKELDSNLKELRGQRKLLEPRLDFTSAMQAELEGQGEMKEIVEEYDEEKEKLWDEQHRKNVRKYKDEVKERVKSVEVVPQPRPDPIAAESVLWSRLDELEKIEEERGEMESEDEEDTHPEESIEITPSLKRRVSWADQQSQEDSEGEKGDAENDDDDYDDDSDYETERSKPVIKKIIFKHSPTPAILPHQVSASGDAGIESPSDIYKLFSPKPILKKTGDAGDGHGKLSDSIKKSSALQGKKALAISEYSSSEESTLEVDEKQRKKTPVSQSVDGAALSSARKAFTGLVVEKSTSEPSHSLATKPTPSSSSAAPSLPSLSEVKKSTLDKVQPSSPGLSSQEPKRVSRFKAARMKQHPP